MMERPLVMASPAAGPNASRVAAASTIAEEEEGGGCSPARGSPNDDDAAVSDRLDLLQAPLADDAWRRRVPPFLLFLLQPFAAFGDGFPGSASPVTASRRSPSDDMDAHDDLGESDLDSTELKSARTLEDMLDVSAAAAARCTSPSDPPVAPPPSPPPPHAFLLVGVVGRDGAGSRSGGSRLVFRRGGVPLVAAAPRLGAVGGIVGVAARALGGGGLLLLFHGGHLPLEGRLSVLVAVLDLDRAGQRRVLDPRGDDRARDNDGVRARLLGLSLSLRRLLLLLLRRLVLVLEHDLLPEDGIAHRYVHRRRLGNGVLLRNWGRPVAHVDRVDCTPVGQADQGNHWVTPSARGRGGSGGPRPRGPSAPGGPRVRARRRGGQVVRHDRGVGEGHTL